MKNWEDRPITSASLLNPAFCGEIIRRTIFYYKQRNDKGFPYPLLFLILPVVLSQDIRKSMPLRSNALFHTWVQENEKLLFDFAYRTKISKPYTQEAVSFLIANQAVQVNNDGTIEISKSYRIRAIDDDEIHSEIKEIYKKAELLGKWYSQLTPSTIYMFYKIRP